MISISEVGTAILGGFPGKFYVFAGSEYGVKCRYIDILKAHHGQLIESESVNDVLKTMRTKRLIPLSPAVYVVRYDEAFVASLSETTAKEIAATNIVGTIVCIYENSKHVNKLDKFLPKHTVSIDAVSPQFVKKYLQSDFPNLPSRLIDIAVTSSDNYGQARLMCSCMDAVPHEVFSSLDDQSIAHLFGRVDTSTEGQIKRGVASRNFNYLLTVLESFEGESDEIFYAILSTMIELDKIIDNSRAQSDLREYIKRWTREDIYYMFMHTYKELENIRSMSVADTQNVVIYLFGLLAFTRIPSLEDMQ